MVAPEWDTSVLYYQDTRLLSQTKPRIHTTALRVTMATKVVMVTRLGMAAKAWVGARELAMAVIQVGMRVPPCTRDTVVATQAVISPGKLVVHTSIAMDMAIDSSLCCTLWALKGRWMYCIKEWNMYFQSHKTVKSVFPRKIYYQHIKWRDHQLLSSNENQPGIVLLWVLHT